ncbi:MAG: phosphoribosyl-AMP cyclohydrolase [Patescibacteria group bacterium]
MKEKEAVEELELGLDFSKLQRVADKCPNVIPVVVQDWRIKEVLGLVYINQEALVKSWETGMAFFWSTSRNKLWLKGEEKSGCFLKVKEIRVNCDQNSLLFLVEKPENIGFCHTKNENGAFRESCFYRQIVDLASGKLVFS